ncbi:hypothetical protein V6N11_048917 [Hibiscus sabdariffa]|uniref:Phospholipase/carboxylesterase/thioesterase domain-containing protein n=1 Tax=Hibiscus sabdariffa TaxID=183260 RepID=A0ABR2PWR8_9ROSI
MSYSHNTMGSGSRTARRTFEFGRTHVVRPKGKHQATIVWLHGLGDNGSTWSQLLESLPLPNIKWICPTAPTRPVALLGGFPYSAWFDVGELSADGPDDWEGLDASAAHIANLLSTEPSDVKVGIGGFSMGAAMALYSATAFALGRYGNGNPYNINLRAIVGLSGWLPGSRCLRNKIEVSHEAARRAASLPIMLGHGTCDDVVPYKYGEISVHSLSVAGFRNLSFKNYEGIGHYTVPKEMNEAIDAALNEDQLNVPAVASSVPLSALAKANRGISRPSGQVLTLGVCTSLVSGRFFTKGNHTIPSGFGRYMFFQ